jgi:hypothetical protein
LARFAPRTGAFLQKVQMKIFSAFGVTLALVLLSEARVDAYLDPGSGSMLIQLLLGGVAGAAVILKLAWQRLQGMFGVSADKERHVRSDD